MSCSPTRRSGVRHPQSWATPRAQAGLYSPGVRLSAGLPELPFSLLITAAIPEKLSGISRLKLRQEPKCCLPRLPVSPHPSSGCNSTFDSL